MTQQEILDYNKRCAEFLGWKLYGDIFYRIPPHLQSQLGLIQDIPCEGLVFDSDWNWIMEVVESIKEKTKFTARPLDEHRGHCRRSEEEWYATTSVTRLTITTPKESVVQAIRQFLTWYNENKNN